MSHVNFFNLFVFALSFQLRVPYLHYPWLMLQTTLFAAKLYNIAPPANKTKSPGKKFVVR